eukprot:gene13925-biopygen9567
MRVWHVHRVRHEAVQTPANWHAEERGVCARGRPRAQPRGSPMGETTGESLGKSSPVNSIGCAGISERPLRTRTGAARRSYLDGVGNPGEVLIKAHRNRISGRREGSGDQSGPRKQGRKAPRRSLVLTRGHLTFRSAAEVGPLSVKKKVVI